MFIEKAKLIHNNKYDYSLVEYVNNKTKVKIICPIHGVFEQRPDDHLNGKGCRKCGYTNRKKKPLEEFIQQMNKIHNNKYDYSLVEYVNNKTKVKIICPEHGIFEQKPVDHLRYGCPYCAGNKKLTTEQFIERAKKIHNYDYSLVEYKNADTKVKIICPVHGVFEQLPSAHLQGQGCSKCRKSKMESSVIEFFTKNNIEFVYQKKFKDLKDKTYLSYDFYIPSKNLLIECQGKQHYIQNCFNRNRKDFLLQKHHDWLKRNYARKNNFELLTVSFDENIDSFLKKCYTYTKEER